MPSIGDAFAGAIMLLAGAALMLLINYLLNANGDPLTAIGELVVGIVFKQVIP